MATPEEIALKNSILRSTKKLLMVSDDEDAYDLDITTHINSAFATLYQAGVGPLEGFQLENGDETWDQFIGNRMDIANVKSYIHQYVLLLFDRPTSGFGLKAVQDNITEYLWRLNVAQDFSYVPISVPITP